MKTVKPISAHSTEHTVTFAFSAFFVTLCVVSLAAMPKPSLIVSNIKQISKQQAVKTVITPAENNSLKKQNK